METFRADRRDIVPARHKLNASKQVISSREELESFERTLQEEKKEGEQGGIEENKRDFKEKQEDDSEEAKSIECIREAGTVNVVVGCTIALREAKQHVTLVNQALDKIQGIEGCHREPEMVNIYDPGDDRCSAMLGTMRIRCTRVELQPTWIKALQELAASHILGHDVETFLHAFVESRRQRSLQANELDQKNAESDNEEAEDEDDEDLSFIADVMESGEGLDSHLICHASEGYYLPRSGGCEITDPLYDTSGTIPGGWIGSSDKLLEELIALCHLLGLDLRPLRGTVRRGGGLDLSNEALHMLRTTCDDAFSSHSSSAPLDAQQTLAQIRHTWFVLFEGARFSCSTGSILMLLQS